MFKKEFKVYSPLTTESVKSFTKNEANDERILLDGVASTTSRDLHDEIVALSAIESMAEQAPLLNIHGDHDWFLDGIMGAIKDATVEDKQLHIKFLVTKEHTPKVRDLLETGVRLGLSIGGYATSYDEKNQIINEIELHEISLTGMPANWDTMGTVTTSKGLVKSNCLTGACNEIIKNMGGNTMTSEEYKKTKAEGEETNTGLTEEDVINLFNELMAEKEETIAQEITDKIESKIEAIVQDIIDGNEDGGDEGEGNAGEEGKPEEEKAGTENNTTSTPETSEKKLNEMITDAVNKSINNIFGEEFVDQVAQKMFDNLDTTRTTKGSKFEEFQKQTGTKNQETEPTEKSTYSSKEAAEILLRKQKAANPIVAAAIKNM